MTETVQGAIDEFYKLKNKYETSIDKLKKTVFNGEGQRKKSLREKRLEYQQLKPKCINCKRPVGSIFTQRYDKESGTRLLKAMCGDRVDPCPLSIVINPGYYDTYSNSIQEMENIIKNDKIEIIKNKNKLLFGYMTSEDAIINFDKLQNNISEYTSLLSFELNKYMELTDNPDIKKELNRKTQEVFDLIAVIKENMETYNETNNIQYVRDVVDLYVNSLTPKLNHVLHLKYNLCAVEYDQYDETLHLIQRKFLPSDLEESLVEPSIIQFTIGVVSKSKTKKNKAKSSSTKTKKNRQPDIDIVSDEDEFEENNVPAEPVPANPDIEIVSDEDDFEENNVPVEPAQNNFAIDSDERDYLD